MFAKKCKSKLRCCKDSQAQSNVEYWGYKHTFAVFFFKLGFNPCKAEQPLWGMELQEKEAEKFY